MAEQEPRPPWDPADDGPWEPLVPRRDLSRLRAARTRTAARIRELRRERTGWRDLYEQQWALRLRWEVLAWSMMALALGALVVIVILVAER